MRYLVIGIDSCVGKYIYNRLKHEKYGVMGTSRRNYSDQEVMRFDIQQDNPKVFQSIIDEDVVAIICIASSNVDIVHERESEAYSINVLKAKELIQILHAAGAHVIWFSTQEVFDGITGGYTEESKTNPLNKYGKMKEEMEKYLMVNMPEVCIFRLAKIVCTYDDKKNLFTIWSRQAEREEIACIRDNRMNFVCVEDIYHASILAGDNRIKGLYNIAGNKNYSRFELAECFFNIWGKKNVNVKEYDMEYFVEKFNFKDKRALNVGLNNAKFSHEMKYNFMDMDKAIKLYFHNKIKVDNDSME